MPYIAIKKIMWHLRLTGRDYLALLLVLVTVTSFASTWIQYEHSQKALKVASDSRNRLRHQRTLTELGLCGAVNVGREINNRDRETLIRSRNQGRHELSEVTDPILRALLQKSIANTKHEIAIRPFLVPLNCQRLVHHPRSH